MKSLGSLKEDELRARDQLTEIRTPKELFKDYNLEKFKLGVLPNW